MTVFTVSKARASSEAVVGVSARVTLKHFEKEAFLLQR